MRRAPVLALVVSFSACLPTTVLESSFSHTTLGFVGQTMSQRVRLDVRTFAHRDEDGGAVGTGATSNVTVTFSLDARYGGGQHAPGDRVDFEVLEDGFSIASGSFTGPAISSDAPQLAVTREITCGTVIVACTRTYTFLTTITAAPPSYTGNFHTRGDAVMRYTNGRREEDGAIVTWTLLAD